MWYFRVLQASIYSYPFYVLYQIKLT